LHVRRFAVMIRQAQLTRTTSTERRWLWAASVVALVAFALVAYWAYATGVAVWEQQIVDSLALGNNTAGDLLVGLNTVGNLTNWAIVVAIAAVAVGALRGIRAGALVGASFFVDFVATLAKSFVERGRPDTIEAHLLYGLDSYGFPSGHTARAAALLGALAWVFVPARYRVPAAITGAVVGGLIMGYARVSLGVHFPTDTLGGLLLGVAWLGLTASLV
jgi:membrane-associated phospholipid phosphatase